MNFRAPNYFPDDSQQSYQGLLNALRGVTQDREDRRRFEIQEARQRASEDFTRRQSEVAEGRAAEAARQQKITYRRSLAKENEARTRELYGIAARGNNSEAAAAAAAGKYVNPETGEEESISFDPGGEETRTEFDPMRLQEPGAQPPPRRGIGALLPQLRQPGAPLEQPPAAAAPGGPVEPPPVGDANGAPAPNPYGGFSSALKLGAQVPQARTTTTMRKPSIGLPGGGRVEIDPEEQKRARLQDATDTADRLTSQAAQEPDPRKRDFMLSEAARIRASLPGASAAGLRSAEMQDSGQRFKGAENEKYQMTAGQKFQVGMRPRAAGPGSEKADADLRGKQLTNETRYDAIAGKVLSNYGFKEGQTQRVKLGDLADQIAGASDSAALAGIARGSFVKLAQGGTGVISDNDMRVFWDRIGGLEIRSQELLHQALDGKLGQEKRDSVLGAIKQMEARAVANRGPVEAALKARFATVPGGEEKLQAYLNTYFPERQAKAAGGAAPAAATPPEGTTKQLGDGSVFKVVGGKWKKQQRGAP